ncbi:HTH-type transcriptional regulator TfdS [Defluviimonas aquaemixtae]|uniref:HTH-type transcriptional regulator TfdS n=1 Tax=Albidovulum aquaemixtae TaxID=1542388 RepID=A0A2R8B589_9RHOB|nr:LysR family transcriptional regulator [Defluviimonas aquaemixtae]SPH17778.1 HTH-type transcriptional regulator TfdS [Defluviimonas aquaemixtae]
MRENWDDLRFILAVAEEGSVSAAARRLDVNHATVLRRVAAYEQAVGVTLFDKTARGYSVPGPQRRIIDAAREVDRAVQAVGRMLQGARAPLAGEVRVTSTDTFCQFVLPTIIRRIRDDAPDLKIELICANVHLDLSRTHADIAVRPTEHLSSELVGEAPVSMGFGLYRKSGTPSEAWLGLSGALSRSLPARWMSKSVDPARIVASSDSFPVLREMAAEGQGMAILPDILGQTDPSLVRVEGGIPDMAIPIWVACHADLADVPRIAETCHALIRALAGIGDRLWLGANESSSAT